MATLFHCGTKGSFTLRVLIDITICFCLQWAAHELVMLLQSHCVNTSITSCTTHLLQHDLQSEKNAQWERALKLRVSFSAFILLHPSLQAN